MCLTATFLNCNTHPQHRLLEDCCAMNALSWYLYGSVEIQHFYIKGISVHLILLLTFYYQRDVMCVSVFPTF